jgi:hypothetical protein
MHFLNLKFDICVEDCQPYIVCVSAFFYHCHILRKRNARHFWSSGIIPYCKHLAQRVESLDHGLCDGMSGLRVGTGNQPTIGDGKRVPRSIGGDVLSSRIARAGFDSRPVPRLDRVQDTFLFFPFGSESSNLLASDDALSRRSIDRTGPDGSAVTDGGKDPTLLPDVGSQRLKTLGFRVVDQGSVTGRGEEETVLAPRDKFCQYDVPRPVSVEDRLDNSRLWP